METIEPSLEFNGLKLRELLATSGSTMAMLCLYDHWLWLFYATLLLVKKVF